MDRAVIHPTAVVDEGAVIGPGTQVWHFSHVMSGARIGRDCRLGQNVFVGRGVVIGRGVKIQNNVSLYAGVTLDDDVFCGPSAVFTNVKDPRSAFPKDPASGFVSTRVGRGATIGANATIVCGTRIGEQAFIGAGAVVTRDVPAYALVYGNPARLQGWMCLCGERLTFAASSRRSTGACRRCHRRFAVEKRGIRLIDAPSRSSVRRRTVSVG